MRVTVVMIFLTLAGPLLALAAARDDESDLRLVVIPPWRNAETIVTQAGGHIVGPARARFAVFARPQRAFGFSDAARDAGAILVLNGAAIASICGMTL